VTRFIGFFWCDDRINAVTTSALAAKKRFENVGQAGGLPHVLKPLLNHRKWNDASINYRQCPHYAVRLSSGPFFRVFRGARALSLGGAASSVKRLTLKRR